MIRDLRTYQDRVRLDALRTKQSFMAVRRLLSRRARTRKKLTKIRFRTWHKSTDGRTRYRVEPETSTRKILKPMRHETQSVFIPCKYCGVVFENDKYWHNLSRFRREFKENQGSKLPVKHPWRIGIDIYHSMREDPLNYPGMGLDFRAYFLNQACDKCFVTEARRDLLRRDMFRDCFVCRQRATNGGIWLDAKNFNLEGFNRSDTFQLCVGCSNEIDLQKLLRKERRDLGRFIGCDEQDVPDGLAHLGMNLRQFRRNLKEIERNGQTKT